MVVVRYLSGDDEDVGECENIAEVRSKVCKNKKKLWPYVGLCGLNYEELTDDAEAIPLITVVINEKVEGHHDWVDATLKHAIYNDEDNLLKILDHLKNQMELRTFAFRSMWQRYWTRKPQGHVSVVNAAASFGYPYVDDGIDDMDGCKALYLATKHGGSVQVVQRLLDANANVDLLNGKNDDTALLCAASVGKTKLVNKFLDNGADYLWKNKSGLTALHNAAMKGKLSIVNKLIRVRSDVNVKSKNDFTPLHYAIYSNSLPIVKALVEAGANIDPFAKRIAFGRDMDVQRYAGDRSEGSSHQFTPSMPIRFPRSHSRHVEIAEYLQSRPSPVVLCHTDQIKCEEKDAQERKDTEKRKRQEEQMQEAKRWRERTFRREDEDEEEA